MTSAGCVWTAEDAPKAVCLPRHTRIVVHEDFLLTRSRSQPFLLTAPSGEPPLVHERLAIAMRGRFGFSADRLAQYKVIRHRGAARSVRGDQSERDARLDTSRAPTCHMPCPTGSRDAASQPARAVRGRPWLKQRVEESHRGECPAEDRRGQMCANERDSGRLAARRAWLNGRRLSAPTHGTSVPLPGSARGCQ